MLHTPRFKKKKRFAPPLTTKEKDMVRLFIILILFIIGYWMLNGRDVVI